MKKIALASCLLLQATFLISQSVDKRLEDLISQMSADEKIHQLTSNTFFTTGDNVRLEIPGFIMSDGPHGVRFGGATSFPTGIAQASSWDVDLIERVGRAMGEEFWSRGKHQQLGPCLDLCRDPRNGRSPETLGEDPYLAGKIGAALINGIQQTPVVATAKHFNLVNRQQYRSNSNITISERMLMEHYGHTFRMAVQEAGVMSVMNAYNLINGVHCSENQFLLQTILRERWGFPYYIVSDWGAIHNSEKAIKAGTDICMGSDHFERELPDLVNSGILNQTTLDNAVGNVLRTKLMAGMLDNYPRPSADLTTSAEHQQLVLEAGRKALVLLKNEDNILPFDSSITMKIALIGPSANKAQLDGFGSSWVEVKYSVSPREGIEKIIGRENVEYVLGCEINSDDTSGFAAARAAAANADIVVFVGGLDDTQEGEGYGSRLEYDRAGGSVDLPGMQQDLINELAEVNSNLVVVIKSGGICGVNRSLGIIKGLIYAFYPGQEGGNAIAEALFGIYNPGGKLPVTMPTGDDQLPEWNDDFNDDYGCGYRWYDEMNTTPEFAFGFGLSYTEFLYGNIEVSSNSLPAGQEFEISFDLTNTGNVFGEEVAQLYLSDVESSLWMPEKQLKGFQRVSLNPDETKRLFFKLSADDFYYWDENTDSYKIETGSFVAKVGGSSDKLPLAITLQISGAISKPDLVISNILSLPRYPLEGDTVRFIALVRNTGTEDLNTGTSVNVEFAINEMSAGSASYDNISIPTGGMIMVEANEGYWIAKKAGPAMVIVTVDQTNTVDESIESNNRYSHTFDVFSPSDIQFLQNIALNKPVYSSSSESSELSATYAVDGNLSTRWSSGFSDPQEFVVSLQDLYQIKQIRIHWETAYSDTYEISVSNDSIIWLRIISEENGKGGLEVLNVDVEARYIRLKGLSRATDWGHSFYEFEAYGDPKIEEPISFVTDARRNRINFYPNPVKDLLHISSSDSILPFIFEIFNSMGQRVYNAVLEGNSIINLSQFDSGVYCIRIQYKNSFRSSFIVKL